MSFLIGNTMIDIHYFNRCDITAERERERERKSSTLIYINVYAYTQWIIWSKKNDNCCYLEPVEKHIGQE